MRCEKDDAHPRAGEMAGKDRESRRDATSASWNGFFREMRTVERETRRRVRANERIFFERAFFVSFFLSVSRAYHSSFSLVVTKQQVKPITKLAVHSSLKTRTSTTPRSTDLSSDSRTNASFARLSTPPSREDVTVCQVTPWNWSDTGLKAGFTNYPATYATGLLCARRMLTKYNLAETYEGKTDDLGEDYHVEAEGDARPLLSAFWIRVW